MPKAEYFDYRIMNVELRLGEVIAAGTTEFTAQCYELYQTAATGQSGKDERPGKLSFSVLSITLPIPVWSRGVSLLPEVKMRPVKSPSTNPAPSY